MDFPNAGRSPLQLRRRIVKEEKSFQTQVQKIGALVHELEEISDPATRARTKELVQLLMDLHGKGMERMLEIVFEAGDSGAGTGARTIDELGRDPLVSSLLVLYGLHPLDLEARVERKLEQIGPKLRKMGAEAKLLSVSEGNIRLQAKVESHSSCGSSKRTLQGTLEDAMYEAAPDLASVVVEGLEEPAASSFVGVEALLASSSSSSSGRLTSGALASSPASRG